MPTALVGVREVRARGDADNPIISGLVNINNSNPKKHVFVIDNAQIFGADPATQPLGNSRNLYIIRAIQ
jgi:hypothetical protein